LWVAGCWWSAASPVAQSVGKNTAALMMPMQDMLSNTLTYFISEAGVEEVPSTLSDSPTRQLANKREYFRT